MRAAGSTVAVPLATAATALSRCAAISWARAAIRMPRSSSACLTAASTASAPLFPKIAKYGSSVPFPVDDPVELGGQPVGVRVSGELGVHRGALGQQFLGARHHRGVVVPEEDRSVAAGEVGDGDFPALVVQQIQRVALGTYVLDGEPRAGQDLAQIGLGEFGDLWGLGCGSGGFHGSKGAGAGQPAVHPGTSGVGPRVASRLPDGGRCPDWPGYVDENRLPP
ncbi:hypothetical protein SMICM17S_00296 [Streptomyces microflavus]